MPVFTRRRLELLALLAVTAAFLAGAGRFIGIDRHDETLYLASAPYTTLTSFYTHQSWAPLYSVWYGGLTWVLPDPLARYFGSWALLVSFLALLPAVLKLPGAWTYTLPLVTLPILALGPFVSLFAACLLLSGMCLLLPRAAGRAWSLSFSAWLACMLSFVVAFIRPEFEFGVLFAAGITLLLVGGELWRARSEAGGGRRFVIAAGKIVSVLLLAGVMHAVEQRSSQENRPGVAFLQHFNVRAAKRHLLRPGEDPYFSDYAMRVFHLPTGPGVHDNTYPLGAYVHADPRLFASHLVENLLDRRTVFLLAVLLLAWLLPWLRKDDRGFRPAALFLFCISLPPLAGIIVVFPRDHYAITLVPAIAILLVQLPRPRGWLNPSPALSVAVAVAVLCCLGVSVWRLRIGPFDYQRKQLARVRCARAVDRPLPAAEAVVIDPDNNLAPMIARRRLAPTVEAGRSLAELDRRIAAWHPLWIVADDHLAERFQTPLAELNQHLGALAAYSPHACPSAPDLTLYTRTTP